jgi:hypothetical protein
MDDDEEEHKNEWSSGCLVDWQDNLEKNAHTKNEGHLK